MNGKTHLISGLAAASLTYHIINRVPVLDIHNLQHTSMVSLIVLGAAAAGSLAPDIDIPESSASATMTLVNMKFVKTLINMVLLGLAGFIAVNMHNAYAIYGGVGLGLLIIFEYTKISYKLLYWIRVAIQYGIVTVLVFTFFRTNQMPYIFIAVILFLYVISKHRGLSHTLILSLLAAYVIYYSFDFYGLHSYSMLAAGYYLLGNVMHIFANDYFTNAGVPNPVYPLNAVVRAVKTLIMEKRFDIEGMKRNLKGSRVKFFYTIQTGSSVESLVCLGMMILFLLNMI